MFHDTNDQTAQGSYCTFGIISIPYVWWQMVHSLSLLLLGFGFGFGPFPCPCPGKGVGLKTEVRRVHGCLQRLMQRVMGWSGTWKCHDAFSLSSGYAWPKSQSWGRCLAPGLWNWKRNGQRQVLWNQEVVLSTRLITVPDITTVLLKPAVFEAG